MELKDPNFLYEPYTCYIFACIKINIYLFQKKNTFWAREQERNSLDEMSQIYLYLNLELWALRTAQWRDRSRTDLPASGGL